jgi:hypothetical protein
MSVGMQILYSLLGGAVIAAAITWYFSWYFSKKSEKVAIDISGFMMQEISKNPNYVYPYYIGKGKDRKLHKAVLTAPMTGRVAFTGTVTAIKNEGKKD